MRFNITMAATAGVLFSVAALSGCGGQNPEGTAPPPAVVAEKSKADVPPDVPPEVQQALQNSKKQ